MSALVKLSSKLPGDPYINGVDAIAGDLAANPDQLHIAVVWFDVQKVTIDTDTGDHVPTIRLQRFEPVGTLETASQAFRDAVGAAMEARTGRKPIPFEIATVDQIPVPADPDGDPFPSWSRDPEDEK